MGDAGRRASKRIHQFAEFKLSDSQRQKVGSTLRKRSDAGDCSEAVEDGVEKEEGEKCAFASVVRRRSRRARMSVRSSGVGLVRNKSDRSGQLLSTALVDDEKVAVVQTSSLAVSCDVHDEVYERLDASFYDCAALELAPKLLGKLIRRDDVILRITEVEAYGPGDSDSACHARVGQTPRNRPLFGRAGHAYVYLCYGMHVMLNVSADREGVGAGVLIRACSPVAGLGSIQLRRGQVTVKPVLLTGPGKVGKALGLTTDWSSHPLYLPGGLEILDAPPPPKMLVGPRVGIDYAEPKDVSALWRFALADTPWPVGCHETSSTVAPLPEPLEVLRRSLLPVPSA